MTITANSPRCGHSIHPEDANELIDGVGLPRKHVGAMLAKQGIELDVSEVDDDNPHRSPAASRPWLQPLCRRRQLRFGPC